jgi:hypothetical protein
VGSSAIKIFASIAAGESFNRKKDLSSQRREWYGKSKI